MKITLTLKSPDCDYPAVEDAVAEELANTPGIDEEEREAIAESRCRKIREQLGRWLKYGEYLTVEFDLLAGTATVKEVRGR